MDDQPERASQAHLVGKDPDQALLLAGEEGRQHAQARARQGGAQLGEQVAALDRGRALGRDVLEEVELGEMEQLADI